MKAVFICNQPRDMERVYGLGRMEKVRGMASVFPGVVTEESIMDALPALADVEVIFSTWGMFAPEAAVLDRMPRLKAVLYAAGSVKGFARPFLTRGIQVSSAVSVNARFVTEFAVSEILLAAKGFFSSLRGARDVPAPVGNYGIRVGIIGAGNVGRQVMAELSRHEIELWLYDPFVSAQEAEMLGAKKAELAEIFRACSVVSNHAPNIPETRGMLTEEMLRSMPGGAVFINTGRGATVDEDGLCRVMAHRPDLTCLLDVTDPEPPAETSPLRTLGNVCLTPHIAGALGQEVVAMADLMIGEYQRLDKGLPLQYGVELDTLDRMA